MKKIPLVGFSLLLAFSLGVVAQNQNSNSNSTSASADSNKSADPKRKAFRATADQIKQAQTILKQRNFYAGEESGKWSPATRAALVKYQTAESLKATGDLDRATVTKMGIALTAEQAPPSRIRFTSDQMKQAQAILKQRGFYAGEQTGKLNSDTRAALVKYQQAEGLTPTGNLNRATMEKMGIALTEEQKPK